MNGLLSLFATASPTCAISVSKMVEMQLYFSPDHSVYNWVTLLCGSVTNGFSMLMLSVHLCYSTNIVFIYQILYHHNRVGGLLVSLKTYEIILVGMLPIFFMPARRSRLLYGQKLHVHDDIIKWKHFPRYWPFVRGIHRSLVNSPHKGQWRRALMVSLIYTRINGWVKLVIWDVIALIVTSL